MYPLWWLLLVGFGSSTTVAPAPFVKLPAKAILTNSGLTLAILANAGDSAVAVSNDGRTRVEVIG